MNFDRLNQLSNYFLDKTTSASVPPVDTLAATTSGIADTTTEISDWGIEESILSPTISNVPSSSIYSHPGPPNPTYLKDRRPSVFSSSSSHTYYQQQKHQDISESPDFQYYYQKYCGQVIPCTTENFCKYIKKYLSMENKFNQFWEKFKYDLVLSNLLQDSMILSKNEQSLTVLTKSIQQEQANRSEPSSLVSILNPDGCKLYVNNKQYKVIFPEVNPKIILLIINLIIYLLKQRKIERINTIQHLKMFKILLILSTKLIKLRKFTIIIQTNQILNLLQQFLISNYTVNKKIILTMINLKQLHTFTFQDSNNLRYHLLNSLEFLILNLTSLVRDLLPAVNGELLQQYCNINTIDLQILTKEYLPDESKEYLDEVLFNITKFNQLRKLFICQLLTLQVAPNSNFFLCKLMDQFNVNSQEQNNKLDLIKKVLTSHNQICNNIISLFEKFEIIDQPTHENDDILKFPKNQPNLESLITKLTTLTQNLQFLEKLETNEEKLTMINQFKPDLTRINQLYSTITDELTSEFIPNSPQETISSGSSSFNLKSFHTRNKSIPDDVSEKKRLSAGLQLGLVTVVEEPQPELDRERYHQITLDQLSNKKSTKFTSNRFSLNSVKSNVSGLTELINTQITSAVDDEEVEEVMSKDALRIKLEESFNRIFNLENENKLLKENIN